MTWSYNGALTNDRDKVRLFLGDTDSDDQLPVSDAEVDYALTEQGSIRAAAALCAEWLAARYTREVSKSVGSLSIQLADKARQFRELAAQLRANSALYALPYAGGISIANKDSREDDSDRVEPAFYKGQLDNPNSESADDDDED